MVALRDIIYEHPTLSPCGAVPTGATVRCLAHSEELGNRSKHSQEAQSWRIEGKRAATKRGKDVADVAGRVCVCVCVWDLSL